MARAKTEAEGPAIVVEFDTVDPGTLVPHPRNPNQGDTGALAVSLQRFGMYAPIIANRRTGHILAGNHTRAAAIAVGMTSIAVGWVDVDEETELGILVGDNQIARLALNNEAQLAEVLAELAESRGLDGTGFDGDDLDALLHSIEAQRGLGDARPPADSLADYEAGAIRSVILPMSVDDYDELVTGLQRLRSAWAVETNAQVVLQLIEQAVATLDA